MGRLNPTLLRARWGRPLIWLLTGLIAAWLLLARHNSVAGLNGFDMSALTLPPNKVMHGGPPRDGIPAIDQPHFLPAGETVDYLADDDLVLGLTLHGDARAYPLRILDYHEIVNDRFGNDGVLISYCPLCGSGMAFRVGRGDRFGVSGLLYNSDMLLYDRASESLWSQILGRAVSGPRVDERLDQLPLMLMPWGQWRAQNPHGRVLSTDTGHERNYARSPYPGYGSDRGLYFPVDNRNARYHPKERVIAITLDGAHKVYPYQELARADTPFDDRIGQQRVRVHFDRATASARITDRQDRPLPATYAYWFAWMAFHPDSEVFDAGH